MTGSRSLQEICCLTQAAIFNLCLTDADLRTLGTWEDEPAAKSGLRPAVRCRGLLHRACLRDAAAARRVADLLDLRYLDTVVLVRCMAPAEAQRVIELWLARPDGESLPGLLWALCTDARPCVHALGARLGHEATLVACRALVE